MMMGDSPAAPPTSKSSKSTQPGGTSEREGMTADGKPGGRDPSPYEYQEETEEGVDGGDGEGAGELEEEDDGGDVEIEDKFHCRLWYQHSRIDVRVYPVKLYYFQSLPNLSRVSTANSFTDSRCLTRAFSEFQ